MLPSLLEPALRPPSYLTALAAQLTVVCLDLRSVWSLDHDPDEPWGVRSTYRLLAFGDCSALERLRKCTDLAADGVELMVVIDGDVFETAWGSAHLSGSLARWAWRRVSEDQAYYDEARWARLDDAERVVRVRRKALLIWQSADAT